MPSFSKMGTFPVGYFRATSQWLLKERRDVAARVAYLQAEMERIGCVTMYFRTVDEGDDQKVTEQPVGFSVTPGSSLAKLVQAYIALGGNIYNVSKFLRPDTSEFVGAADDDTAKVEKSPGGGIVAPESVRYNNPLPQVVSNDEGGSSVEKSGYEGYEGGYIKSHRYYPGRMGGRIDRGAWDSNTIVRAMHDVRKWANPTIKGRLQNMEWRIIKLSDLCEQLEQERDHVLMEAFGGQLNSLPWLDPDKYDPRRLMQNLVADLSTLLMETDENTGTVPTSSRASREVGHLFFAFESTPEEVLGPMG